MNPTDNFHRITILTMNVEHSDLLDGAQSSLSSYLDINAPNDVLEESSIPVVRALLTEAYNDLSVVEQTISLFHTLNHLLIKQIQTDHDPAYHSETSVVPQPLPTPNHLYLLHSIRSRKIVLLEAALAPHKNLPPELLAIIFIIACEDHPLHLPPESPSASRSTTWSISKVCTRWRHIALNEPRLWTNVAITGDPSVTPERVRDIFTRSAGIPISLKMDGDCYSLITDILLPHLGIFQHLDLSFLTICYSPLLGTTPPAGSIDSLESVKLDFKPRPANSRPFDREDPITVFAGARNLQKVEFQSSFYRGWYTLDQDVLHLPWAQLTDLCFGTAIGPTISRAHAILRQSTRLVNCTMNLTEDYETPISPNHTVSTVICPLLESLNLIFIQEASVAMFLQPLVLPSLIDIAIRLESEHSCEQPELLSLIQRSMCSITSVTMKSKLLEIFNVGLLEKLPSLKKLEAQSMFFSSDLIDRMSVRDLLPNLEVLYCVVRSPGSFVDMLERRATAGQRPIGESDGYPRSGFWVVNARCRAYSIEIDKAYKRWKQLERVDGESLVMRTYDQ